MKKRYINALHLGPCNDDTHRNIYNQLHVVLVIHIWRLIKIKRHHPWDIREGVSRLFQALTNLDSYLVFVIISGAAVLWCTFCHCVRLRCCFVSDRYEFVFQHKFEHIIYDDSVCVKTSFGFQENILFEEDHCHCILSLKSQSGHRKISLSLLIK